MKNNTHAVLVLGMHRSGTSATTGALALRGLWPGNNLMQATAGNPKGHWEHMGVYAIHEQLLAALGRSWDDLRPLPEGWTQQKFTATARDQLRELITTELMTHPVWIAKDPRLCRLLPLWLPLLEELGIATSTVLVVRDPREVAQSLLARNQWPLALSRELWWQHISEAIQGSHGLPRHVLTYPRLLANPAGEIEAAVKALRMPLPTATPEMSAQLRKFISAQIRHHEAEAHIAPEWKAAVSLYRQLSAQPVPWDKINATLEANVLTKRPLAEAVGEYARLYTDQRRTLAATRNNLNKITKELEQSRQQTDTARGELDQARHQIDGTRQALDQSRQQLDVTREELDTARQQAHATQQERDQFRHQLDSARQQLEHSQQQYSATQQQLERSQLQFANTHKELERSQNQLETTRKELDTSNLQLNSTHSELQHTRTELDTARGELDQARHQIDGTRQALDQSRSELQQLLSSRSWRLTRPLRWLSRKLHRG